MENPIKMDDLGAHPYFWKHPFSSKNPSRSNFLYLTSPMAA